jgi:hypothetical protein
MINFKNKAVFLSYMSLDKITNSQYVKRIFQGERSIGLIEMPDNENTKPFIDFLSRYFGMVENPNDKRHVKFAALHIEAFYDFLVALHTITGNEFQDYDSLDWQIRSLQIKFDKFYVTDTLDDERFTATHGLTHNLRIGEKLIPISYFVKGPVDDMEVVRKIPYFFSDNPPTEFPSNEELLKMIGRDMYVAGILFQGNFRMNYVIGQLGKKGFYHLNRKAGEKDYRFVIYNPGVDRAFHPDPLKAFFRVISDAAKVGYPDEYFDLEPNYPEFDIIFREVRNGSSIDTKLTVENRTEIVIPKNDDQGYFAKIALMMHPNIKRGSDALANILNIQDEDVNYSTGSIPQSTLTYGNLETYIGRSYLALLPLFSSENVQDNNDYVVGLMILDSFSAKHSIRKPRDVSLPQKKPYTNPELIMETRMLLEKFPDNSLKQLYNLARRIFNRYGLASSRPYSVKEGFLGDVIKPFPELLLAK